MVEKLLVEASAIGTLRAAFGVADGTPGRAHTTQRALFGVPGIPADDLFPAEVVSVKPVLRQARPHGPGWQEFC